MLEKVSGRELDWVNGEGLSPKRLPGGVRQPQQRLTLKLGAGRIKILLLQHPWNEIFLIC